MGGFDDTILISFKTRKVIKSRLHTTRSGNHGTRQYLLFPGRYVMYTVSRSNLGNVYITVEVVAVSNGEMNTLVQLALYEGQEQKAQLSELDDEVRTLLLSNKDHLPLFRYLEAPGVGVE